MDDLFEEDKKRKSAEKNEVDWTDVCILHEIGFICFQETKVPKIPLETERLLITEKLENGDKKIKIDSLDGDDISNYINDNNHKSDSDDLFKSSSIKTDLPKE